MRFALTDNVDTFPAPVVLSGLRGFERELRDHLFEIAAADLAENLLSCGHLPGSGCECEIDDGPPISVHELYPTC